MTRGGAGGVGSAHRRFRAEAPTPLFATLPSQTGNVGGILYTRAGRALGPSLHRCMQRCCILEFNLLRAFCVRAVHSHPLSTSATIIYSKPNQFYCDSFIRKTLFRPSPIQMVLARHEYLDYYRRSKCEPGLQEKTLRQSGRYQGKWQHGPYTR